MAGLQTNMAKEGHFCCARSMSFVTARLQIMSSSFTLLVITMAGCGIFDSAQFLVYPFILEFFCKSGRKHVSSVELFYVLGYASGVIDWIFLSQALIMAMGYDHLCYNTTHSSSDFLGIFTRITKISVSKWR